MTIAGVEFGKGGGTTSTENAELREARKRIRLLERVNEILCWEAEYLFKPTCRICCTRSPASLRAPRLPAHGDAYRANVLFDARNDAPEFGYRFSVDEALNGGEPMALRTAWRASLVYRRCRE